MSQLILDIRRKKVTKLGRKIVLQFKKNEIEVSSLSLESVSYAVNSRS